MRKIRIRLNQHSAEPGHKSITIRIVSKDLAALNCSNDNVAKRTWSVNLGFSWHTNANTRFA